MTSLPASIEAYLQEAGFTATEILVLKKLLEGEAVTLRELATRTGKSTGVLDQATKKLLQKKILMRQNINDSPKYILHSLESVQEWMKNDMQQKRQLSLRKYENFEAFLKTLKTAQHRPEIEYFEGREGVKRAYMQLLERGKVFLRYGPTLWPMEEDPLRDFRMQYFRACRQRKIFTRVITHNTPLGRRYQSRDPFEFRQTVLVPEDEFPFKFEKIIVGDTVACFKLQGEENAFFIRLNDFAEEERSFFELLWNKETMRQGQKQTSLPILDIEVPIKTRILSRLREFFLSRNSFTLFVLAALFSAIITFGIFQYTQHLTLQRMKDKVVAIATTAVSRFNPADVEALQVEEDWKKPEWAIVVNQLKDIKEENTDIQFTYIFRKVKSDPTKMEFVSEAESLNPYANLDDDPTNDVDDNGDGIFDTSAGGSDVLAWPTQPYPTCPIECFEAYEGPMANRDFYEDQWGKVITGYAPIKDTGGNVLGILAIDMSSDSQKEFTGEVFAPFGVFIFFFVLLIIFPIPFFTSVLSKQNVR